MQPIRSISKECVIAALVFFICEGCNQRGAAGDAAAAKRTESAEQDAIARKIFVIPEELKRTRTADPAADVRAAIGAGDFRWEGVYGYSIEVPGIPREERGTNEVKAIPGTTDGPSIGEQQDLQKYARDYAANYNRILSAYLKTNQGAASIQSGDKK